MGAITAESNGGRKMINFSLNKRTLVIYLINFKWLYMIKGLGLSI